MRRPLSTTTALVTSLALAVPVTFPAAAQAQRSRAEIRAEVCTESMSREDCQAAISSARRDGRPENDQQGAAPSGQDNGSEPEPRRQQAAPEPSQDQGGGGFAPREPRPRGQGRDGADVTDSQTALPPGTAAPSTQSPEEALAERLGRDNGTPRNNGGRRPVEDGGEGPSEAATEAASGAAEAPLAAENGGDAVEESTQTVTEDNARSSAEDFPRAETRRGEGRRERDRAGRRENDRDNDDDNDLTRLLQGVVIGAAGALVVGSLLNDDREVVGTAPDRVVVRDRNGHLQVLRDDDAILRQPGSEVTTRRYADGSTETVVLQPDGSQVVTIRNAEARVVKRVVIHRDGSQTVLFDDTRRYEPVVIADLPEPNRNAAPQVDPSDEEALRVALMRESGVGRAFSLNQIRQIDRVRYLAPAAQVENITFDTGSAAISPAQARNLLELGELMTSLIEENPNEVFLIEGHTDAVGDRVMNLTLSDRRAESVARALTEYFGVSPANLVLQGYGESDLRVQTLEAERANRRVVVRRITDLLQAT